MVNKSIFRTYDIRGKVKEGEIDDKTVELIGKAFGTFLLREGINKTVVGFDSRSYSEHIKGCLVKGLISTGCDVIDIGMCLSPILYFAQYHFDVKGGVMVTASHNPNGWTGFKLGHGFSKSLLGDEITGLYDLINNDDFEEGQGKVEKGDVKEAYYKDLLSRVKLNKKLKVVIECGNGTAGAFTPELFRRAGCDVVEYFCDLDPSFPNHNPNPELIEVKTKLANKVKEENADIGISFDGDADRIGVVDEKGNDVISEEIIMLLARLLLKEKPGGKVVFDVKCSQALEEDIKAHGGIPIMWKTGHSHIKKKGAEEDAILSGEKSGHIFIRHNFYGFDDAPFVGLKLLEYIISEGKAFSEILSKLPSYFITPIIRVHCKEEAKFEVVDKLVEEFKQEYDVIDVDGARVLFCDGWGLVRTSNTEPLITLVFESKTKERIEDYKKIFREKLSKHPEINREWENEE